MRILALEPNSAQAEIIQRIVKDLVPAKLTLVESGDELRHALSAGIPDLVLLPALLSPVDEAALFAQLRALPDSAHVEILITPILRGLDGDTGVVARGLRGWLTRSPSRSRFLGCDPRVFAERLAWSLREAKEARTRRAEPRPLPLVEETPMAHVPKSERRVYQRYAANELSGVRLARFKNGPLVTLVDFSAGGVLLETDFSLQPDADEMLELVGESLESLVPLRIVRCQVSRVRNGLRYLGACSFAQPMDLTDVLRAPSGVFTSQTTDVNRFDVAVKTIIEQREGGSLHSVVALLQEASRSRPFDPVARATHDLLAVIASTLERCGEHAVTVTLVEEQLRAALPSLTARFASAPGMMATADREALYFRVSVAPTAAPLVLNVELPQGSTLEDWQFRLLKTSAYIAAFLTTAPVETVGGPVERMFAQSRTA